jgi:hypothetical protein
MPLKTRGREDGIADSDMRRIDSVVLPIEFRRSSMIEKTAHSIVAARRTGNSDAEAASFDRSPPNPCL